MNTSEITSILIESAGGQSLPPDVDVEDKILDESLTMNLMEVELFNLIKNTNNFTKLLHDAKQKEIINKAVSEIINKYEFVIRDTYYQLWQYVLFNKLNDGIKILDLIKILKTRIKNKGVIDLIERDIRTESKINSIVKKILNIQPEFTSIFLVDKTLLSTDERIIFENIENEDKRNCSIVDSYLSGLKFTENEDSIIVNLFTYVSSITNDKKRNEYYNKFLNEVIDNIDKQKLYNKRMKITAEIPKSLINILIQVYLYLINHEVLKTVDSRINQYFLDNEIKWFTYQVKEFTDKLIPHWNFKTNKFILDKWQKGCIKKIDAKSNILLCAPTSSGKTLLSTHAIRKYRKVIFCVPEGALGFQVGGIIYIDLIEKEKLKGAIKKNIRIKLDSFDFKRFDNKDDIIVCTPKELYNLISNEEIESNIDYIILDEFHNISYDKGEYYEYVLKYAGFNKIPTICLSATIPNYQSLYEWLSTILYGELYGINETKRFFNQKRLVIQNKELNELNPLEHLKKEVLKSKEFTHIGMHPNDIMNLYQKLVEFPRVSENEKKFVKLDDMDKLERDIFKYLKDLPDERLDAIISNKPIEADSLSIYDLYDLLKKSTNKMKPMLIFKMNSKECLDNYHTLIKLIKDYSELVYENFNDDQSFIQKYLDKCEMLSSKLVCDNNSTEENCVTRQNIEEKKNDTKRNLFEKELYPALIKFYNEYKVINPLYISSIEKFNKKYGANLTIDKISKLRNIHVKNELSKLTFNGISLRNEYTIVHDESKLINFNIDKEEMRKIKKRINRELIRETPIKSQLDKKLQVLEAKSDDSECDEEIELISYTDPFMMGIEFGLLCYNELMKPAFQRVTQFLISKYQFITFSDKSLAVGINYPIKTVMLLGGLKGEPIDEIDNSLAHQAIGRAGRRGLDKEGIVIYSGVNIDSILIPKYRQIVPNNPELIEELFTEETEDFKKFIRTGERVVHEVKVVVKSVGVKSNEVKVESNSSCNSSSVKCNAQLLEKINIIKEKLYKLQVDWLKLSDLLDFLDIVENNVSPTLDHIQLLKILEVSNTLEEIEGIALPV